MTLAASLPDLKRLDALRERRVELAERALAEAASTVRAAEAELAARERRIVELDLALAELGAWFASGVEARLLASALQRRAALKDQRVEAEAERLKAAEALCAAVTLRIAAADALVQARAKADAAALQLKTARRQQARSLELAAEADAPSRSWRPTGMGAQ